MIIDNYRIFRYSARDSVYHKIGEGPINYNCFENDDVTTEKQLIDGVHIMIDREIIGIDLRNNPGNYFLELSDNDDNAIQLTLLIKPNSMSYKIIKPSKVLDYVSHNDILINMILGQPISKEFAAKCNASVHTRGSNRYLKYKKLFIEKDGEYIWKNSVDNRIAKGILEKYNSIALEELYEDLTN